MYVIAQANPKQIDGTNQANLALKAFTRELSCDCKEKDVERKQEASKSDDDEDETTVTRKESRALSWARFLHRFEVEVKPSVPRRMNSYAFDKPLRQDNSLPNAKEKLWKSFTTVAAVTDVKKLKSSFANASNAIYAVLSGIASRGNNAQQSIEEKMKWLIDDDMEQFREIKKEMRRRKLVTHSAIKENLEDIVNSRVEALMIRAVTSEESP